MYRNPDANERPTFLSIMIPLQKPDFQILQWRSRDVSFSVCAAKILGAPLQDGFCLYEDLQKRYLGTTNSVDSELELNVVGENVCSRSDECALGSIQLNPAYSLDHLSGSGEAKHDSEVMKEETPDSIRRNPTSCVDHLTCCSDSIETKPCSAYYQDDDYI
jgi:hypothetical protein